ncbi:unnamed protein product [Microthlaspi erraticum]|uniref:Uncharacterized protein n=1 Tax=Microthlaspi erraticum TaxID=1685480 RepID=A0A6D2IBB3_9BRAS|nr:unnamed protein product [Microthlaspi erraticum]
MGRLPFHLRDPTPSRRLMLRRWRSIRHPIFHVLPWKPPPIYLRDIPWNISYKPNYPQEPEKLSSDDATTTSISMPDQSTSSIATSSSDQVEKNKDKKKKKKKKKMKKKKKKTMLRRFLRLCV